MKRDELLKMIRDGKKYKNNGELADAILVWHEKELDPLRKVWKKYQGWVKLSNKAIYEIGQAIKTVLGE